MKLIGLSGPVGVGKDTIADYLVENHGFAKFSFSDPLYEEVAVAFGVDKAKLYVRETKEQPMEALQYFYCADSKFRDIIFAKLRETDVRHPLDQWLSPRQVTQWWGTEYRRKEDPEYWIKKAALYLEAWWEQNKDKPHAAGLINCSVRFPNERAFIAAYNGEVWHVQRPGWGDKVPETERRHVAERGLDVLPEDKVIVNAGTIAQLHTASILLLGSRGGARIECKPVEPEFSILCSTCQTSHREITTLEAEQEIAAYGEWRGTIAPEAQDRLPSHVDLADYGKCHVCKGTTFMRSATEHAAGNMPGIVPALTAQFEECQTA